MSIGVYPLGRTPPPRGFSEMSDLAFWDQWVIDNNAPIEYNIRYMYMKRVTSFGGEIFTMSNAFCLMKLILWKGRN